MMTWHCVYLLYVDKRRWQFSNRKGGMKVKLKLFQKMLECLRDKKCILNKDKNHMIKMNQ